MEAYPQRPIGGGSFAPHDYVVAKSILREGASEDKTTIPPGLEWKFYKQRGGKEHTESKATIAEAVVLKTLGHPESPFSRFKDMRVVVEPASYAADVREGYDGVLRIFRGDHELMCIRYDATNDDRAVQQKIERAVFDPRLHAHTTFILGCDIEAAHSPWGVVRAHAFSAPAFFLFLQQMHMQLDLHETQARALGDASRAQRCARERLLLDYLIQQAPQGVSSTFAQDRVHCAIKNACDSFRKEDPWLYRSAKGHGG